MLAPCRCLIRFAADVPRAFQVSLIRHDLLGAPANINTADSVVDSPSPFPCFTRVRKGDRPILKNTSNRQDMNTYNKASSQVAMDATSTPTASPANYLIEVIFVFLD